MVRVEHRTGISQGAAMSLEHLSDTEINARRTALRRLTLARRECVRCNRRFKSEGPWNRICGYCHHKLDELDQRARFGAAGLEFRRTGNRSKRGEE